MKLRNKLYQLLLLVFLALFSSNVLGNDSGRYLDVSSTSSFYVAGEVASFVVIKKGSDSKIKSDDKVFLTIDLVDSLGNVDLRSHKMITERNSLVQIQIPNKIESGVYRVYFHSDNASIKSNCVEVQIYGADDIPEEQKATNLSFEFVTSTGINKLSLNRENELTVLVTNSKGQPVSIRGKVFNSSDSSLATLKTDSLGVGRLRFLPRGESYYLRYVYENKVHTIDLPKASIDAAVITINDRNRVYEVLIKADESLFSKGLLLKESINDSIISSTSISLSEGGKVYLPKPQAEERQVVYTLVDSSNNIYARKTLGHVQDENANVNINDVYSKREKVSVRLNLQGKKNLLVKVYNEDLSTWPEKGSVVDELTSEVEIKVSNLKEISSSRVSLFYVDQNRVDEVYYEQPEQVERILKEKPGSSKVWAFQFDAKGKRLGAIDISLKSDTVIYPSLSREQVSVIPQKVKKAQERVLVTQSFDNIIEPKLTSDFTDPDYIIELSNYEKLPTVEELLRAIVPKCRVVNKKGQIELRLVPKATSFRYKESPLIMIDGIPTFENEYVFNLNVDDIEKVVIYNSVLSQGNFGNFGLNGVISFDLKQNAENPLEEFYKSLPLIHGPKQSLSVWGENGHGRNQVRRPDVRNVLYYNLLQPGENEIEFYTSDVSGNYVFHVEWVNSAGEKIIKSQKFVVR